jgi:hypothetical protein
MSSVCAVAQKDSARCAVATVAVDIAKSEKFRLKETGGCGVHTMKHRALKITLENAILKDLQKSVSVA